VLNEGCVEGASPLHVCCSPPFPQVRNTTVARAELRALEERVGALESERGALLDDQEALLVGLQSVEAEAEDHGERLALLEAEVGRIAAVEAHIDRLGLRLVRASSPILEGWGEGEISCRPIGGDTAAVSEISYCDSDICVLLFVCPREGLGSKGRVPPVPPSPLLHSNALRQEAAGVARSEATAAADRAVLAAARDALQPEIADLKDRISGLSMRARRSHPLESVAHCPRLSCTCLDCWSTKVVCLPARAGGVLPVGSRGDASMSGQAERAVDVRAC
jgi:hypothetical protein